LTLDPGLVALLLLAAFLHAVWNALVKSGGDSLVTMALVIFAPAPFCLLWLFFLPPLEPAAVPYVLASLAIHYLYFWVLILSYRQGDLSQVYPIARGSAPALVALGAWLLAAEPLTTQEVIGVAVVSCGIMALSEFRRLRRDGGLAPLFLALTNGGLIAAYLLVDGLGGRAAGNSLTYTAWLFLTQGPPFLAFALWRRRGRGLGAMVPQLGRGILGGILSSLSYGIAIWAMSLGPLAHVVALRETSVLMAAIIGACLLKEAFGVRRILAAALIAGGAVLLQVGG
jgi:drug/metabolite transporter (DMT)-like permease